MTTYTTETRDRLDAIRQRMREARQERNRARDTFQAALQAGDLDAQAIADTQFQRADADLQTAERLESMLLSQMAGVDGGWSGSRVRRVPRSGSRGALVGVGVQALAVTDRDQPLP